jgi:hypothetical protein
MCNASHMYLVVHILQTLFFGILPSQSRTHVTSRVKAGARRALASNYTVADDSFISKAMRSSCQKTRVPDALTPTLGLESRSVEDDAHQTARGDRSDGDCQDPTEEDPRNRSPVDSDRAARDDSHTNSSTHNTRLSAQAIRWRSRMGQLTTWSLRREYRIARRARR